MTTFIDSFRSEWLKKKRSLASWLVVAGAFFTPAIILTARLKNNAALGSLYAADDFWTRLWLQAWESMAAFLLPIGIILATGLVAQIEYKNNAWKQLHATPQALTTVFFAKLLVILVMLAQVFALFNLGLYLAAVVPALVFAHVPYPAAPLPFADFWRGNVAYFVDCLPIVALQYLLSLHYRNFLVPVGAGFLIWFLGIGLLSWDYSHFFPYNYGVIDFLTTTEKFAERPLPMNLQALALVYAAALTFAGWALYATKKDRT